MPLRGTEEGWIPFGVTAFAVLLQPLIWAGAGGRLPWGLLGWERGAAIAWALVALCLVVSGRTLGAFLEEWPGLIEKSAIALLLCAPLVTVFFDLASWVLFGRFGYLFPALPIAVDLTVLVAVALWVRRARPVGIGVLIATLGSTAHHALSIVLFPLDGRRSDMLTSILHGLTLWYQGDSPYAQQPNVEAGAGSWGMMPYLPGTFIGHLPSVWTGADPRWLETLFILAVGIGSIWVLRRSKPSTTRSRGLGLAELLSAVVLLSPYHAFRHELYFGAFLFLTAALFFWVRRRAPLPTAELALCGAAVGIACATRQWAWVYGPFLLVAAARPLRRSWGLLLSRLALSTGIAAATAYSIVAPLVAIDPAAFLGAVFYHSNAPGGEISLGVALAAEQFRLSHFLPFIQAILCAGTFGSSLWGSGAGRLESQTTLAAGWTVLVAVVLLNPFIENYFYLTPSFAAVGFAMGELGRPGGGQEARDERLMTADGAEEGESDGPCRRAGEAR